MVTQKITIIPQDLLKWSFKYARFLLAKCNVFIATTLSPVSLILHFRPSEPKTVNFADPCWSNFCYLCYLFITQQAAIINKTNPRHIRPIATPSRVMIVSLSFSEIRNKKQKKSLHIACIIDNSINYTLLYKAVQSALHTLPHCSTFFPFLRPRPLPWNLRTQIIAYM